MLAIVQPIRPQSLWNSWWDAIRPLRLAFSRVRTFLWFATAVAGLTVRTELAGVTSIIRALNLQPRLYNKLCDHFHSTAVDLDRLAALWTRPCCACSPDPCVSMAGWSWLAMASKSACAAKRCRVSGSE